MAIPKQSCRRIFTALARDIAQQLYNEANYLRVSRGRYDLDVVKFGRLLKQALKDWQSVGVRYGRY